MSQVNKWGLSRDIPSPIARKVRQRCRFGCVKCGFAIYQYHHFDPPFKEAKAHYPDRITLLCGNCHGLVTRGFLSNEAVKRHNRSPQCLEDGFSYGPFDIGEKSPEVILGKMTFINTPIILEIFGKPLLMIESPEELGTPFRISATFHDKSGNEIFRIVRNEWQGFASNWDIETQGPRIIIRRGPGQIALKMRTEPPNRLTIEQLHMFYRGFRIVGREGQSTTTFLPDGRMWFKVEGSLIFINNDRGIVIGEDR